MSKDGLILAFDMDTEKCKTCMLTEITKKPFQIIKRETEVLELIHSDLCDLHATPSLGNKKYFATFIDDASWFCYVYLLHTTDEALDKFKVFKTEVELKQGSLIKRFMTDRGGLELVSVRVFSEFFINSACKLPGSGWVFLLGGGAISWASKKQTCITTSTMKSEFMALAASGKEAGSHMYNGKSRHLGVRHSMVRELIMNDVVSIEFVRSQQNLADHLMKGLARDLGNSGPVKSQYVHPLNGLILFDHSTDAAAMKHMALYFAKIDKFERGLILDGLSNPLFDIYQNVESSKELWDSLEAKYIVEYVSSKTFLDIDKPKGNNVVGPSVVNMVEHNNSTREVVRLLDLKLKTLGKRGIECIFVGYAENSKAFRFYVIEPNESVLINSIIESRDAIFDENSFSSVPRPSLRISTGTEDIGGSVVLEEVTEEVVTQQPKPELRKSKRNRTSKNFGPGFQLYLIEGAKDEVSDQHSYCFNVEDDLKTFDEAMKSHDMDVKITLLNDELKEEMAPTQWHQKFDEVDLSNGYLLNQADKCVYSKFDETGKGVIIFLYVDDMLIFGTNQVQVDLIKEFLSSRFSMKNMGEANVILVSTHKDTSEKAMPNNGQVVSQLEYSRVIGCLINTKDNSSTSGWEFLLGGAAAGKEAKWLRNLILEIPLWSNPIAPISIRRDSAATLAKACSQMYNRESRHLGVRHNMIRELITNGVVFIEFVRSQQNIADHLTKGLVRDLVLKSAEGIESRIDDDGVLDVLSLVSRFSVKKKFKMENSKHGNVPMQENPNLSKSQGAKTPEEVKRMQRVPYALAIGSIMGNLRNELKVTCYTNVGFKTDKDDTKSQSRYVFVLNGGVVDWKSAKQSTIEMSSTYSEYIAASKALMEAV
ncbi:zinc finger, CCHC-type containing protein [Tanacetum coccineum]